MAELTETIEAAKLVHWTDPMLHTPSRKFEGSVEEARALEALMYESLREYGGLGLSACQIGVPANVFILRMSETFAMFNPRIVDHGDEVDEFEEGCLSMPGLVLKVPRYKTVKVRFTKSTGEVVNEKYTGMTARVIQHEMDHLAGFTFLRYAGKVALQMAVKRAAKYGYNYPGGKLWKIAQGENV